MKVTKLPDSIDPNILMKEEIERRNSTCPFCGETKRFNILSCMNEGVCKTMLVKQWYGNKYEYKHPYIGDLAFWEPNYYWTLNHYKCYTCGAEWEGDPYPEINVKLK